MAETERYGVALLQSTRDAMTVEEAAKKAGLAVRIIPTPSKIYASCGFSLKYDLGDEACLADLLNELRLSVDGSYHAERKGLSVSYTKI